MSVTCEICGKEFKNTQGLGGHKNLAHGITGSNTQQPVARLASRAATRPTDD